MCLSSAAGTRHITGNCYQGKHIQTDITAALSLCNCQVGRLGIYYIGMSSGEKECSASDSLRRCYGNRSDERWKTINKVSRQQDF